MKDFSNDILFSLYNSEIAQYIIYKSESLAFDICFQRKSKSRMGSFRRFQNGERNRIAVDYSLHKDLMLIVLCHEIAHAEHWSIYENKYKAHGKEWKNLFVNNLSNVMKMYEFSSEWISVAKMILVNPTATLNLQKFDKLDDGMTYVKNIPLWEKFEYNGYVFLNHSLRRTRYLCIRKIDGKRFLFHANAVVKIVDEK